MRIRRTKMNIFEKMQRAKEQILMANLKKSGKNKFAGYTYYELSDLLPTIIKVCNELKLFTMVTFTDEVATLEIINIEKPEEKIEYTSPMKDLVLKGANAIQALGGTQTYQRRYLYMSAFDIIENDMFDAVVHKEEPKKQPPKADNPLATKETLAKMNELIEQYATKTGKEAVALKKSFLGKINLTDENLMTEAQAKNLVASLTKQLAK